MGHLTVVIKINNLIYENSQHVTVYSVSVQYMEAIKKAFLVNFIEYLLHAKHCSKYFKYNSLPSQEPYGVKYHYHLSFTDEIMGAKINILLKFSCINNLYFDDLQCSKIYCIL